MCVCVGAQMRRVDQQSLSPAASSAQGVRGGCTMSPHHPGSTIWRQRRRRGWRARKGCANTIPCTTTPGNLLNRILGRFTLWSLLHVGFLHTWRKKISPKQFQHLWIFLNISLRSPTTRSIASEDQTESERRLTHFEKKKYRLVSLIEKILIHLNIEIKKTQRNCYKKKIQHSCLLDAAHSPKNAFFLQFFFFVYF